MPLFRLRLIVFSFIAGTVFLSADPLPIGVPSGEMVFLDVDSISIYETGRNEYFVCIYFDTQNLGEPSSDLGGMKVLNVLKTYFQEKWGCGQASYSPDKLTSSLLMPLPSLLSISLNFSSSLFSFHTSPPEWHGMTSCGGVFIGYNSDLAKVDSSLVDESNQVATLALEPKVSLDFEESKSIASGLVTEEKKSSVDESKEIDEKLGRFIELSFSLPSNEFGGGWQIIPYQLGFVKQQEAFIATKYESNPVEEMILVISPDREELYQKRWGHGDLYPVCSTNTVLKSNVDATYTLNSPLQGEFLFNAQGRLVRLVHLDGSSSFYEYSQGHLIRIDHESTLSLHLEYQEEKLVSIKGFENDLQCEYNEHGFLRRISDGQGSFLDFSYDSHDRGNDVSKIVDESGLILLDRNEEVWISYISDPALKEEFKKQNPLVLFNGFHEIYYIKDAQGVWKFIYENLYPYESHDDLDWDDDDD